MISYNNLEMFKDIFNSVISSRSAYGLIWEGEHNNKKVVTKMIMLDTGFHYDKDNKVYKDPLNNIISENIASVYFSKNGNKPYYNTQFVHRRSMSIQNFKSEYKKQIELSAHRLAPEVYNIIYCNNYPIHYAFIVMKKMDCSLKDVILSRNNISNEEWTIVNNAIDKLHKKYKYSHGDMKPSNIGINLKNNKIYSVKFIDCNKVLNIDASQLLDVEKYIRRDKRIYVSHGGKIISKSSTE